MENRSANLLFAAGVMKCAMTNYRVMSLSTNWTVPFIKHYNIQIIIDWFTPSTGRHDISSVVDAVFGDSTRIQDAVAVNIHW